MLTEILLIANLTCLGGLEKVCLADGSVCWCENPPPQAKENSDGRGSGRRDIVKNLKSTTLQSDITVVIGETYYQFSKGESCSISDTRNIGYGPEELITVQGVTFWASASTCN